MRLTIMITNLINLRIVVARMCCASGSHPNSATTAGFASSRRVLGSPTGRGASLHQPLVKRGGTRAFSIEQGGSNIFLKHVVAARVPPGPASGSRPSINDTCLRS